MWSEQDTCCTAPQCSEKTTDPGMPCSTGAEISSPVKQVQGLKLQPVDKGVYSCLLAQAVVQSGKYMELFQH